MADPKVREPVYLGDSVYIDLDGDGYHAIIYTDNGRGKYNEISLEPVVRANLYRALKQEYDSKD